MTGSLHQPWRQDGAGSLDERWRLTWKGQSATASGALKERGAGEIAHPGGTLLAQDCPNVVPC